MKISDKTEKLKRAIEEVIKGTANTPLLVLRWCRITYPKLALLAISIVVAYYIFTIPKFSLFLDSLDGMGYIGVFIAGLLFSFGFTTPFAIGLFATLNPENIPLASLIGGIGALISDIIIFRLIKLSFMDEFKRLQKTSPFKMLTHAVENNLAKKIRIYGLYVLAGFIIASPLPDEIAISMFAGITTIEVKRLALISFIMNTLGIMLILFITL